MPGAVDRGIAEHGTFFAPAYSHAIVKVPSSVRNRQNEVTQSSHMVGVSGRTLRHRIQSQIDDKTAAFNQRAAGRYRSQQARENDVDNFQSTMRALRGDLKTANEEICNEQLARQSGKQA